MVVAWTTGEGVQRSVQPGPERGTHDSTAPQQPALANHGELIHHARTTRPSSRQDEGLILGTGVGRRRGGGRDWGRNVRIGEGEGGGVKIKRFQRHTVNQG